MREPRGSINQPSAGSPARSWKSYRRRSSLRSKLGGAALLAGAFGFMAAGQFGPPLVGCPIKGNISIGTGERIYHVPGQEHYDETRIDLLKGERWFCSEEAARAAGWRRAKL